MGLDRSEKEFQAEHANYRHKSKARIYIIPHCHKNSAQYLEL